MWDATLRSISRVSRSPAEFWNAIRGKPTRIYSSPSMSFCWSRTTITTCAPFSASWRAAARPIPREPPVRTTVRSIASQSRPRELFERMHSYPTLYWERIA